MLRVHVPAHMHTYTYTYMHMHMCMCMHMHISIVKCHVISCHVCMSMCPCHEARLAHVHLSEAVRTIALVGKPRHDAARNRVAVWLSATAN